MIKGNSFVCLFFHYDFFCFKTIMNFDICESLFSILFKKQNKNIPTPKLFVICLHVRTSTTQLHFLISVIDHNFKSAEFTQNL